MRTVNWASLKEFVTSRGGTLQFAEGDGNYYILDDHFVFECVLNKSLHLEEVEDFETNFKAKSNQPISARVDVISQPAFAAKTLAGKKLFKRVHGIQVNLQEGENEILFSITYPWAKINGIQITNSDSLDTVDLVVLDTPTGMVSGVPNRELNQFGFRVNLTPGYYENKSEFDADLYMNMAVKIVYRAQAAKTVGINYQLNEVK